jgi:hypothetical protein
MKGCLSSDAMVAMGEAVGWNVPDAWRHVETCAECQAQMETLRLSRAALVEYQDVDPAVLREVTSAVRMAAVTSRAKARWLHAAEALPAGFAALVVLVSSGIRIDGPGLAALGFTLGAAIYFLAVASMSGRANASRPAAGIK